MGHARALSSCLSNQKLARNRLKKLHVSLWPTFSTMLYPYAGKPQCQTEIVKTTFLQKSRKNHAKSNHRCRTSQRWLMIKVSKIRLNSASEPQIMLRMNQTAILTLIGRVRRERRSSGVPEITEVIVRGVFQGKRYSIRLRCWKLSLMSGNRETREKNLHESILSRILSVEMVGTKPKAARAEIKTLNRSTEK